MQFNRDLGNLLLVALCQFRETSSTTIWATVASEFILTYRLKLAHWYIHRSIYISSTSVPRFFITSKPIVRTFRKDHPASRLLTCFRASCRTMSYPITSRPPTISPFPAVVLHTTPSRIPSIEGESTHCSHRSWQRLIDPLSLQINRSSVQFYWTLVRTSTAVASSAPRSLARK